MATPDAPLASSQQLVYARWLDVGTRIGFVALVAAFAAYVLGIASPHVPVDALPGLWRLPVDEYLAAARVHSGWGWMEHVMRGDYMNLVGVAMLSAVSIVCYARLVPLFWNERDRVYLAIAVLEIMVLLLAASGVLGGGH